MFQIPVNFHHPLNTFVATREPTVFFSCMCPPTLSFQPIFAKFAPIIYLTLLKTPVHFSHHLVTFALWPLWANFVEHDLCSGCGGGGPAGDRTLLVI